jgi:hypothetical protein
VRAGRERTHRAFSIEVTAAKKSQDSSSADEALPRALRRLSGFMRVDFLRPLAAILRFPKLQPCLKRSSNPFPGRIRWEGPPLCRAVWRAAPWRWNGLTQGDTKLLNEFDLTRIQIDAGLYQWEALPHLPRRPPIFFGRLPAPSRAAVNR